MGYRNSDTIAIFEAYGQVSKQDRFEKYKENIMKDSNMSPTDKLKAIAKLEKALLGTDSSSTATPTATPEPNAPITSQEPTDTLTPVVDDKEESDNSQSYQFDPNAPKKPIQYNDDGTMRIGPEIQDDEFETDEFEDGDDESDTTTYTTTVDDFETDDSPEDMSADTGSGQNEWRRLPGTPYLYNMATGETKPAQGTSTTRTYTTTIPASDEEMGLDR